MPWYESNAGASTIFKDSCATTGPSFRQSTLKSFPYRLLTVNWKFQKSTKTFTRTLCSMPGSAGTSTFHVKNTGTHGSGLGS